jgi:hypothetical protein
MSSFETFEQEIEKTRHQVEDMAAKIDSGTQLIDTIAESESLTGLDFDIENARIEDVLEQQRLMEANIADLIIGLEDVTNSFGAEFEGMQTFNLSEKFVGIFSKKKAQSMRSNRVRTTSLATNLQDLLAKSNTIVGILTDQRSVLEARYTASETSLKRVIERRQSITEEIATTQTRIEEISPLLLDVENRFAATTDQAQRTALESERSTLATEYNEMQAKEQELLAASQTLERYTSMFQTFVDSLNNQIAAQETLINKLSIDTEQRIVLYKSLEDSLKTSAQQDVAHQINTIGSQVDTAAEETMAGIGAAAQSHIADLLELHEQSMVDSKEIQRRKRIADDAFARRFGEVMEKHEAARYTAN